MSKTKLHGMIAVKCQQCKAINLHSASGWNSVLCAKCGTSYEHPFRASRRGHPNHGRKAKRVTISIPLAMSDKIKAIADQYDTTPSAIIRAGISSLLQTPE